MKNQTGSKNYFISTSTQSFCEKIIILSEIAYITKGSDKVNIYLKNGKDLGISLEDYKPLTELLINYLG